MKEIACGATGAAAKGREHAVSGFPLIKTKETTGISVFSLRFCKRSTMSVIT